MNILYVTSAIPVPGRHGGATHTLEVARGLHDLGHTVTILAGGREATGSQPLEIDGITLYHTGLRPAMAWRAGKRVGELAVKHQADFIMERYYNFAGAGLRYAARNHLPSLLEINAPMTEPPGTRKDKLDRLFLRSFTRLARQQANLAGGIVTPLATTVPPGISQGKIAGVNWGADVARFRPAILEERAEEIAAIRARLGFRPDQQVLVFVGSFRAWHGVADFVAAAQLVCNRQSDTAFLLVGDGPERASLVAKVEAAGLAKRIVMPGPVPYEEIPLYLAIASAAVAPFNTAEYAPLRQFGFYWSPLKIFEYMAMALPVIVPDFPPLSTIIRNGKEGLVYPEGDITRLALAMQTIVAAPATMRWQLGTSGRRRVVGHYSWAAHCLQLDTIIKRICLGEAIDNVPPPLIFLPDEEEIRAEPQGKLNVISLAGGRSLETGVTTANEESGQESLRNDNR